MAIYTKPPSEDRILGAEGGAVFQKSGNQFSIRKRAKPVLKKTQAQTECRNRFESVAGIWRTLTGTNQTEWEDESPNYPRTDSLGNPYTITGPMMQQSSNINMNVASEPELPQPAAPSAIPAITGGGCGVFYNIMTAIFIANPNVTPAGYSLNIYATPPLQPGNSNPGLKGMKLIVTIVAGDTNAQNFYNFYIAVHHRFGNPNNWIVYAALQYTQLSTGQKGDIHYLSGSVAT